jgi:predicted secreted protein
MSKIAGKQWQVEAAGAAGNIITGQDGVTLSVTHEAVELTTKDSAGDWREFVYGLKGWTAEIECIYDSATSSNDQSTLFWANCTADPPTEVDLDFTDGVSDYNGSSLVTGFEITGAKDGPTNLSISLQGNGIMTKTATA